MLEQWKWWLEMAGLQWWSCRECSGCRRMVKVVGGGVVRLVASDGVVMVVNSGGVVMVVKRSVILTVKGGGEMER